MTTGFCFTTQATQVLEENDFSTNTFFTLNVYDRKQNHDSNTEKRNFMTITRTIYVFLKEKVGAPFHPSCFPCPVSKAPTLTLPY